MMRPDDDTIQRVSLRRGVLTLIAALLVTIAVVFGALFALKYLFALWH